MATALAALHDHRVGAPAGDLLRMLGRADRRNHHHTSIFELRDQVRLGRQRERRDLHALADQQVDAIDRIARVGADVDAERLVRRGLDLADRGLQFVESHGCRRQDAQAARVGCRRHQPRTRHPAHPGLHHRMFDADQFGQRSAQPSPLGHARTSLSRSDFGSITLADQLQLVARSEVASLRPCPGRVPRTKCFPAPLRA